MSCSQLSLSDEQFPVWQDSESLAQPASSLCLPPEIWSMVFQRLDLSSTIAAMQVGICNLNRGSFLTYCCPGVSIA